VSPSEADAVRIAAAFAGEPVRTTARFPQGLAHFVYDVALASGRTLVVRIGRARDRAVLAAAVRWSRRLRPLGVPLPQVLASDTDAELPYLVLERLPGADLGDVYASLAPSERRALALEIAAIQARVGVLPDGGGFGFVLDERGPFAQRTWPEVLRASLARSRARIEQAGAVPGDPAGRVERALARLEPELSAVRPRPFLDDTTTKNVIVAAGRLSGIVDVDWICYGDPLFPVALTRAALRAQALPLDYVDVWADELAAAGAPALHLYTALFCADFLSEMGQRFNRDAPLAADPERVARLSSLLDDELRLGQLA